MIRASSNSSNPFQSISLFLTWHNFEDPFSPTPDRFTYPFVLKACSKLKQKRFGQKPHANTALLLHILDDPLSPVLEKKNKLCKPN
ncbi:hypothetical protein L2E82_25894 [Cichorium intybus]|uniref:Uncharacterized protein n=1 Tax=Cichorium intybus TaxID=13427 RepID=A0ACB9E598_CICIN|nr:hypothetical protein L2E82_25894 [Cichorium intybus]